MVEKKYKVLVVDDDESIRETLVDFLELENYEVDDAEDGYKALDLVSKKEYDVVLLDIRMPGINGVQTLREIRKIAPYLNVIMMTAGRDLVEEALLESAYTCLFKPFILEDVIRTIRNILALPSILIIEDDTNFLKTLELALKENGFKIITAIDCNTALNIFKKKEEEIDFILLDIRLPDADGGELLKEIKEYTNKKGIKLPIVIAMSAFAEGKEIEEILRLGAFTFFKKPFDLEAVFTLLKKLSTKDK
jgi:two-component system response regulator HydG